MRIVELKDVGIKSDFLKYYASHIGHLVDEPIRLVEIGVQNGNSMRLWEQLYPKATIFGIDILKTCKRFETKRTKIYIGDQTDADFLKFFIEDTGGDFDVVIDDGGHRMKQQIESFRALFPTVKSGGIYAIEDLNTSYSKKYGGGLGNYTTMDMLKGLTDSVNRQMLRKHWKPSWGSHEFVEDAMMLVDEMSSVCFHPWLCVITKS